jgi:hypothetical protein
MSKQTQFAVFCLPFLQCLSLAVQLFDEVLVAPHLDPVAGSSKRGKWRNMLRFDPLQKDQHGFR